MSLDFDINVDYYAVLGIDEQATPDELKTARKSLVLQYHPDVSSSSDATIKESAAIRFRAIQNAYEILSDAATRAKYDSARNIILGKSLLAADDTEIARGFVTQQDNYNFQVKKMASSNWQEIAANRLKTTAWQKLPLASKKVFTMLIYERCYVSDPCL
jgi:DnaJ-class molecular chaperone